MNDGLVLAALKALSNETKALVISNELVARRMPSFQLRAIFNAMIQNEDERRGVVDLVDKDLQASGYAEDQVFALLNDLLTAPNALQMNEGVQSTRRLRSPFTQNFESQMPPLQIGAGMDARQTAPPLMGAVQYNPRSAYGSAIPGQPEQAGAQPTGNSQYFARQGQPGAPGQGGHQSPIPDQNYAPSQRAALPPLSPAALAARASIAGMPQGPQSAPGGQAGTGNIPPYNPAQPAPLPSSARYTQNRFSEADAAALAAQALHKPAGFNKNSYDSGVPSARSQTAGPLGMPMGSALREAAGQQVQQGQPGQPGLGAPGMPNMPGMPSNYDRENMQSASATAQAVSEAALLTPGLANLSAPLTSRVVSRESNAPVNFQSSQAMNARRNDGRPIILIADDDKRIRMVFRLRMEESGLTVVECSDGTEAWERIQQGDISLAVLDMKMPGLHGLEVLSRMADKQFRIPVIVCSAYDQLKDEFVVQTYPRLRYLVKPVAPEQLVGSIKELLNKVTA